MENVSYIKYVSVKQHKCEHLKHYYDDKGCMPVFMFAITINSEIRFSKLVSRKNFIKPFVDAT